MTPLETLSARHDTALILIDIQNSFMPGGALGVPHGNEIMPAVEHLAASFDTVILTQDWHPPQHSSFASSHDGRTPFDTIRMPYGDQVLWPDHCIIGSEGAGFALPQWIVDKAQAIVRKGFRPQIDSYSAFIENDQVTATGLKGFLVDRKIKSIVLAGLATDYCVGYSAIDGAACGFRTSVFLPGCRGISDDTVEERLKEMRGAGVTLL